MIRFGKRHALGLAVLAAIAVVVWWPDGGTDTARAIDPSGASPVGLDKTGELDAVSAGDGARRTRFTDELKPVDESVAPSQQVGPLVPGPHVQGIVTAPDDTPLAGVRLTVVDREPRETVSDENGRFSFGLLLFPRDVSAELEGWMQVAKPTPQRDRDQAFRPLHVVMARTATLEVEVHDASSKPVSGVSVVVDISPAELHGRNHSVHRSWQPPVRRAETDEFGVARLTEVAANCRLVVRVEGDFEWMRGSRLCGREPGARPIVLESGESRRLVASLGSRVRIAGRVLEPNGSPSAGASVAAHALDVVKNGRPVVVDGCSTDEDGRFAMDALVSGPSRRVLLVAESTVGRRPSLSPFGGPQPPDPLCVAWVELDLDPTGRALHEPILTVRPMPKIAGVLVDSTGRPVSGSVRLVPHDATPLVDRLITGRALRRDTGSEGNFLFHAVTPGIYDVIGTDHGRPSAHARDVAAGTTDLRLELPDGVPATVQVEVLGAKPLREIIVMCSRLYPLPGVGDDAPLLPKDADYADPVGWPEPALGLWYGAQEYYGELGTAMFSSGPIREGNTKTYELSEGLYWFGAKGVDTDRSLCFPIGTGLVRVGAGEHHLRFHLTASGALEGVVEDAAIDDALCVALATEGGRLVPLDVRRNDMAVICDLAADGRFRFAQVPTGRFELRVGTAEELRAGAARRRSAVVIEAGETLRVTL